jgi:predicted secreted protein
MKARLLGTATAIALGIAGATAVRAGDAADAAVFGFSADGSHFAFEQFGIQDGSGYPYTDVFIVNVAENSWASGTPVSVLRKEEDATLAGTRVAALRQAGPLLAKSGIGGHDWARALLRRLLTDRDSDPHRARFTIHPQATLEYELALEEHEAAAPDCPAEFGPYKRFALDLVGPDGSRVTLQRDDALPKSRGCPTGYRIAELWLHDPVPRDESDSRAIVVLLHAMRPGFEGPDVRFIAVGARTTLTPF